MYRVGIIGPEGSVKRITGLAKRFAQEIEFLSFIYEEPRETGKIIREHDREVDSWLCSGHIPYGFALAELGSAERIEYIWVTESSFYKSLLDLTYSQVRPVRRISIDMPENEGLVDDALSQIEQGGLELHTRTYELDADTEDLLHFHLSLWQEGRTEGAVTCFPNVAAGLKARGVHALTVSPSSLEIIQSLRLFTEKVRTSYFKDTQIGVEIIELEDFDRIADKLNNSYQLQYLELKLKEELIQLCERLDGSFMEKGGGKYVIFSTRGAIERELKLLSDTVDYLAAKADTRVAVGIGYGKTVFSAETNAQRALIQSKLKADRQIVIIREDGVIVEAADQEDKLSYSIRNDDREISDRLQNSNLSVKTFNKVAALARRMEWESFTAKELADQLQMTERNARRIMTELSEAGLADSSGEEAQGARGRPTKRYRLK